MSHYHLCGLLEDYFHFSSDITLMQKTTMVVPGGANMR